MGLVFSEILRDRQKTLSTLYNRIGNKQNCKNKLSLKNEKVKFFTALIKGGGGA